MIPIIGLTLTSFGLIIAVLAIDKFVVKPSVRAYFWDSRRSQESRELATKSGAVTIQLFLRNEGDLLRLWKPAATQLTGYIYFPDAIKVKEIRRVLRHDIMSKEVYFAGETGRFGRMNYVEIPSAYSVRPPAVTILSYGEDVHVEIDVEIPDENENWPIFVQIVSAQGDLGVASLNLIGERTRDRSDEIVREISATSCREAS